MKMLPTVRSIEAWPVPACISKDVSSSAGGFPNATSSTAISICCYNCYENWNSLSRHWQPARAFRGFQNPWIHRKGFEDQDQSGYLSHSSHPWWNSQTTAKPKLLSWDALLKYLVELSEKIKNTENNDKSLYTGHDNTNYQTAGVSSRQRNALHGPSNSKSTTTKSQEWVNRNSLHLRNDEFLISWTIVRGASATARFSCSSQCRTPNSGTATSTLTFWHETSPNTAIPNLHPTSRTHVSKSGQILTNLAT